MSYGLNKEQGMLLDAAMCETTNLEHACTLLGVDRAAWMAEQIKEQAAMLADNADLWAGIEDEEEIESDVTVDDKAASLKRDLVMHISSRYIKRHGLYFVRAIFETGAEISIGEWSFDLHSLPLVLQFYCKDFIPAGTDVIEDAYYLEGKVADKIRKAKSL